MELRQKILKSQERLGAGESAGAFERPQDCRPSSETAVAHGGLAAAPGTQIQSLAVRQCGGRNIRCGQTGFVSYNYAIANLAWWISTVMRAQSLYAVLG